MTKGSHEQALADSLRQLIEAKWTLSDEYLPEDVREVLANAAGFLIMNHHAIETCHKTIKLQGDFITAMGNEMRAAGCEFDEVNCKVINTCRSEQK